MEERQRLFLAVALPDDVRHGVAARLREHLGDRRMPGKPVAIENWHITLRFLGSATPMQRDSVLAHLDQHIQTGPFRMRFACLGAFPRPSRASTLWVGVATGADGLAALAADCETAADAAGFEPEGRPFHPHLTIARIRPPESVRSLIDGESIAVTMDVAAVTMYRSILAGGRPVRYEAVETVEL
jgi:2'-5' RNA ligase